MCAIKNPEKIGEKLFGYWFYTGSLWKGRVLETIEKKDMKRREKENPTLDKGWPQTVDKWSTKEQVNQNRGNVMKVPTLASSLPQLIDDGP